MPQCACKKGHRSEWDGKCGHCRTKNEIHALRIKQWEALNPGQAPRYVIAYVQHSTGDRINENTPLTKEQANDRRSCLINMGISTPNSVRLHRSFQ